MLGWLQRLFDRRRWDVGELARRLGINEAELCQVRIDYHRFDIPKRRGGTRTILAPAPPLKQLQKRILRRLLAKLKTHPACHGFEPGRSIVTNALPHACRRTVIRLDIKDFFTSTSAKRVEDYFRSIGWKREAAALLTRICTYEDGLPQGAPTSPRLANLVNYLLDARLANAARGLNAVYTRYADDLTFSTNDPVMPAGIIHPQAADTVEVPSHHLNGIIPITKVILVDFGYRLHTGKKLRIMRRNQRQLVTGLVVNERPRLPRETRRRLRAIEHHVVTGRPITLTPEQLAGWHALAAMIER